MSWPKIKNHCFEVLSPLILNKSFFNQIVTCDKKWILWQPMTTRSVARLRKNFKAPSKDKFARKNVMVNVWWSATGVIHYSSLNSGKTVISEKYAQESEMHQKLPRLQPTLINRMGMSHNQHFKSWTHWAMTTTFCLIHHIHLNSHQPSFLHSILTTFCRQNISTPSRRQKCFPRVHQIMKLRLLCYRNKQKLFSVGKNVLIVMVTILINKDVFEPSYSYLKFTVWNHNYFCTN